MSDTMIRLAQRCSQDRAFLGYWLSRYAAARGLSLADVLEQLGAQPEDHAGVCICGAPRPVRWDTDLWHIAERFGLDARALGRIVKEASR